jgi:flagellar biosynthesis/type III secretory pathway chaperone
MHDACTPEQFERLLREQGDLLGELLRIGGEQREAIEAGRVSELLSILARKQPSLERLGQIRQLLQDWRETVEETDFWPDSQLRVGCQQLRDQSASAFKALIEQEQACEAALMTSRDQIQIRLERVDSGRTAANAYQNQATTPSGSRVDFSSMG